MATQPQDLGGGWTLDPQNPNRAIVMDPETGAIVDEAFRIEPVQQQKTDVEKANRGSFERFKDSYTEATQYGFPGWVARKWYDWTNTGVDILKKRFPGQTDDWYEAKADAVIGEAQKTLRAEFAARREQDPTFQPDQSVWENAAAIDRWGPDLFGQLFGSAGPESAINPGGTALARIGSQSAVAGGSDLLYQGLDLIDGARDEYNVNETLASAALGGALQGGFEGVRAGVENVPGFIKDLFKKRGKDTTPSADPRFKEDVEPGVRSGDETPEPVLNEPVTAGEPLTPDQEKAYLQLLESGSVDDILAFFDDLGRPAPALGQLLAYVDAREKGNALPPAVIYEDAPATPTSPSDFPEPDPLPQDTSTAAPSSVQPTVQNLDNFESPNISNSGRIVHEVTAETDKLKQVYSEIDVGDPNEAAVVGLTIDKTTGKTTVNINTAKIENAGEAANTVGPRQIRAALSDIVNEFPEIKEITGVRKTGDGGEKNISQTISPAKIEALRKQASKIESGPPEGVQLGGSVRDFEKGTTDKNLGLGRFTAARDVEEIIDANRPPQSKQTWDEWIEASNKIRDEAKAGLSLKSTSDVPQVLAARRAVVKSANTIADLADKIEAGDLSDATRLAFVAEVTRNADLQEALRGVRSNAARLVNSWKINVDARESFADQGDKIFKALGNRVFDNDENLRKFANLLVQARDNPEQLNKIVKDSLRPKAEDYLFKVYYNMLLSSPSTHLINFLGTGTNVLRDILELSGASVKGQFSRFSKAERVMFREVAYRVFGLLAGLRAGTTWASTRKALNTGVSGNAASDKTGRTNVYSGDNKAAGFASGLLESPVRALAGADEFWRNLLQTSNIYGLAVRNAGNKGLKGQEFWDEVQNLIEDPTQEMINATNHYTKVLQFLDKPSKIAQTVKKIQTVKASDSAPERAGRFAARILIPFVDTPDSLIRTFIRRNPVLAPLERETVRQWKAGGAERDQVKARLIMSSALGFWLATQAQQRLITGEGPQDPQKRIQSQSIRPPNSIKVGDSYISYRGLDPLSTDLNVISTLIERYKAGEIGGEELDEAIPSVVMGFASSLAENAYLENVNTILELRGEGLGEKGADFGSKIGQQALTSFAVPSLLRTLAQARDPAVRDTTGDGSTFDRIEGRIRAGTPGFTGTLPQKYDVFGREITRDVVGPDALTRFQRREVEDDPAVLEVERLSESLDKLIVGPPSKTNINVFGEVRNLTAEEFQKYQGLSGFWILQDITEAIQDPVWPELTDEEKAKEIKLIRTQARKDARQYLFQNQEEEEEDEDEDEEQ